MKKIAYIIGISQPAQGLLTLYKHIASHIIYAKEKGYIPIVDCKHYINQYFKDKKTYIDNSWEYFFEQPDGYTLDDLKKFDEIILSQDIEWADSKYEIYPKMLCSKETEDIQENKYALEYSKYLKFNQCLYNFLESNYKEKVENNVVLGVLCRGTDYVNIKPAAHSIQPSTEQTIQKTKEIIQKNSEINKIYLATEDESIYKKFKETFGSMLISNEQYMFSSTEQKALADVKVNRNNHFYNLGKEYLASLYILSKCPYFIGGRNNGSLGVYFLSSLFANQKYVYIFNLGLYGNITYSSFLEKIFSIKKEYTFPKTNSRDYSIKKCHTYITILGIKLRISRNIKAYSL